MRETAREEMSCLYKERDPAEAEVEMRRGRVEARVEAVDGVAEGPSVPVATVSAPDAGTPCRTSVAYPASKSSVRSAAAI